MWDQAAAAFSSRASTATPAASAANWLHTGLCVRQAALLQASEQKRALRQPPLCSVGSSGGAVWPVHWPPTSVPQVGG